jgi:hypothetical protein
MKKLNEANFVGIEREHEERSSDSVMAMRESNQEVVRCAEWKVRETAEEINPSGNAFGQYNNG